MLYYFLCATPCAVKLNGEYVGKASENFCFLEFDEGFLEFIPLDQTFFPVSLFLDKTAQNNFQNAQIIDLYGGFLIIPAFSKKISSDFKVISKHSFSLSKPISVSCYNHGGVKLFLSNGDDFFIDGLPFCPEKVTYESCSYKGVEYVVAVCIAKRTLILGYSVSGKITPVFKNVCDGYGFENNYITTLENKNDLLCHSISSKWAFKEDVKLTSFTISTKRSPFSLPEKLLPYAFFEEFLIGGDVTTFLSPRLKDRAEDLKEFLGDFKQVLPPPHFKSDDLVTLLYNDKVEYAKVEISRGVIENVIII
ncbi:MAG: hypothetical protein IJC87_00800 [Clostridia bacterium]|nr:hypothetical protein [Clostridia bacterium]